MPELSKPRTIAITRPREDGAKMAAELEAQGYKTFLVPMLSIELMADAPDRFAQALDGGLQAICLTSKHASHLLNNIPVPVFAVGEATAKAVRATGCPHVFAAADSAASLLALISAQCRPEKGTILYLRGEEVTLDLAAQLAARRFQSKQIIAYRAAPVQCLPAEYIKAVQCGEVDEILFFSRASAENYLRLAGREHLEDAHSGMIAHCLSENIAEALKTLPWKRCDVSMAF